MPSGFKINRHAIAEMMGEIQREFDKHPIRVPIEANDPDATEIHAVHHTTYSGPVINIQGDRARSRGTTAPFTKSKVARPRLHPGMRRSRKPSSARWNGSQPQDSKMTTSRPR